jgi:DNA-binding NarL/FixJ family response regulator
MPGSPVICLVSPEGLLRSGLTTMLRAAGYRVTACPIPAPRRDPAPDVVLVVCPTGAAETVRQCVARHPQAATLVVLDPRADITAAELVHLGARAVLPTSCSDALVFATLSVILAGGVVLDPGSAGEMATASAARCTQGYSDRDVDLLRRLATGLTVAALAKEMGYSDRNVFRMLGDLYGRLGCRNRSEALLAANRLGLL